MTRESNLPPPYPSPGVPGEGNTGGIPTRLRLLEAVAKHARLMPHAAAVCAVGSRLGYSWTELNDRIASVAAGLRQALGHGGTVLLCHPNDPDFIAAFLGTLAAGNAVFPVSADAVGPELQSAAQRAGAVGTIVSGPIAESLKSQFRSAEPFPEVGADAVLLGKPLWEAKSSAGPALLLQSSGTTSRPKLVRREGESLDAVASAMVKACGFGPSDHVLAAVPLCHSYGLEHGLLAPMLAGSCVHICRRFDLPAVLGELKTGGITMLPGVPFMFDLLAHADGPFPSLRKAYSAGGPLPESTFRRFQERFGIRLGQVYGATEIGSVTFNDPDGPGFVPQSVGKPMEGVSVRIVDADEPKINGPLAAGIEGQVAIAAASMFSGYIDEPTDSLIDAHYLTGDLGILDANGALTITGRLKLLIDVGGRKVNPAEVEEVLRQFPGVGACVVIPMRLSETVCRLKAIVTPAAHGIAISSEAIRSFLRERLSAYKVPRVIEVRESLPTSASGKVLRRMVETSG